MFSTFLIWLISSRRSAYLVICSWSVFGWYSWSRLWKVMVIYWSWVKEKVPWTDRGWPLTWGTPPCRWATARWGCPCTCRTSSHKLSDRLCSRQRLPWLPTLQIKTRPCEWKHPLILNEITQLLNIILLPSDFEQVEIVVFVLGEDLLLNPDHWSQSTMITTRMKMVKILVDCSWLNVIETWS